MSELQCIRASLGAHSLYECNHFMDICSLGSFPSLLGEFSLVSQAGLQVDKPNNDMTFEQVSSCRNG